MFVDERRSSHFRSSSINDTNYSAEALKMTGVLEDLPGLSDEQSDMVTRAKNAVLRTTEDYRVQIRRTLSKESLQNFVENEKTTALAFAGGAVAGALL